MIVEEYIFCCLLTFIFCFSMAFLLDSRKESETKEETHIWQMILPSNKTKHNG